jgi:mitofilin
VEAGGSSVPPPPEPVKKGSQEKSKKKTSFTGLLFRAVFVASLLYGGTLYVATKNNTVMDYVIDNDFPYADEILDYMEKTRWDDVVAKYNELKSSLLNMEEESSKKFESFTSKLEQKTEEVVEETR